MLERAPQTKLGHALALAAAVLLLALFTLLASGCSGCKKVDERDIKQVTTTEVQRLVARAAAEPKLLILLDARPEEEFRAAHLPGARSFRPQQVDCELGADPAIARFEHIIVYAEHPNSATAKALTKRLLSARYKNVRLFDGGVDAWKRSGLALYASE